MPTGKFAISGLRVFGNGHGAKPTMVQNLVVLRTEKDKRSAFIKWSPVDNAFAYNIYYGTSPDKLYSCIMIHDLNEYWFKSMDKDSETLFALKPVTFRYKKEVDSEHALSFGLIAEDVAEISPALITRDEKGKPQSVRYEAVNAMLLNELSLIHI